MYDLKADPDELNNVYGDPAYAEIQNTLKTQFAQLRKDIGDDGSHYPECEKVVQEFWDYSEEDQAKAVELSHAFLNQREESLKAKPAKKRK